MTLDLLVRGINFDDLIGIDYSGFRSVQLVYVGFGLSLVAILMSLPVT